MNFKPLLPNDGGRSQGLEFRPLSFAMAMMIARAGLLLAPILYLSMGKPLTELLQDNLSYLLYYLLAMFDLLCFVELYFVKKQLEKDAEPGITWMFGATLLAVQAVTLNAMSVGCMVYFLYRNRGRLELRRKIRGLDGRSWLWVAVNALVLVLTLALFYYLLSLFLAQR